MTVATMTRAHASSDVELKVDGEEGCGEEESEEEDYCSDDDAR
jgi:hypothetical protein